MTSMKGINPYDMKLSDEDIEKNIHRGAVGGLWDEMQSLQAQFLINTGLKPQDKLLDIGCGCLRGGIAYMKYLDEGNYFGLDINASLIHAGEIEIQNAGLQHKRANLLVDDKFLIEKFNLKFKFMVSISLFTHLSMNLIVRCLNEVKRNLAPDGVYYSTIFVSPTSANTDTLLQEPGNIVTHYDSDPYHYSLEEMSFLAAISKLQLTYIGDWGHPRNQKMLAFRHLS